LASFSGLSLTLFSLLPSAYRPKVAFYLTEPVAQMALNEANAMVTNKGEELGFP